MEIKKFKNLRFEKVNKRSYYISYCYYRFLDLEFTAKLSKMSPSIRLSHSFVNTTSATLKKIKATSTNTLFTKKYCPLPNISHFGGKLVIPSNFSFFKIGSKLLFICDRGWFVKGKHSNILQ